MPQSRAGRRCVLLLGWKDPWATVLADHDVDAVILAGKKDLERLQKRPTGISTSTTVRPVSDISDAEDVLCQLYAGDLCEMITDIHTESEFALSAASVVGEHLGIPHIPISTIVGARHKGIQKNRMRSAGFPVAGVTELGRIWSLDEDALASASYPAVLKPATGAGAYMTSLVRNVDEARACLAAYSTFPGDSPELILETLMTGSESVANGLVRDGKIRHLSFIRYSQPVMSGDVVPERTCVAIDPADEATYDRARVLCEGMVEALRFQDTIFHMECFELGDQLFFSEVASRSPGCGMAPLTLKKFGLDFVREGLLAALRLPEGGNWVTSENHMATLDFPGAPGIVVHAPSEADVLAQDGVIDASMAVKVGDVMGDMRTTSSWRIGSAVVQGVSEEQLWIRVEKLYAWVKENVTCIAVP